MFGKRVIRLGDPTSHGGVVVSAASNFVMFDKNVARIGDVCTCPVKGHNNCVIVEGDPVWTIDGKGVALEGCKTSCGAVLLSTLPNVMRSYEGEGSAVFGGSSSSTGAGSNRRSNIEQYDEQVKLVPNGDSIHLVGLPYFIETKTGRAYSGRLDEDGVLPRIETQGPDDYAVYWGDEALKRMQS